MKSQVNWLFSTSMERAGTSFNIPW